MHPRTRAAVVAVLFTLAAVSGLGGPAGAGPADQGARSGSSGQAPDPARERAFDALAAEAEREGPLRVMVELAEPATPEGDQPDAAVARQRDRIAAAGDDVGRALAGTGSRVVHRYRTIPFVSVEVSRAGLERLRARAAVRTVAEVEQGELLLEDTVPAVLAPEAWDLGADGSGQLVAVIDTGMESSPTSQHPDLAARVVHEACFNGNGDCPGNQTSAVGPGAAVPCATVCYHGTAVASVVAAVAPGAGLYPINIASPGFLFPQVQFDDMVMALDHLATATTDLPLAAVNLSLGWYESPPDDCDTSPEWASLRAAIANLTSLGITPVAGAGNGSHDDRIAAPACLSDVLAVAATDLAHQQHASYSDSSAEVDIWAPGGETTTVDCSDPGGVEVLVNNASPDRCRLAGTSFAAPHVAGAVAVMYEALTDLGTDEGDLLTESRAHLTASGQNYTDPRNGVTRPKLALGPAVDLAQELVAVQAGTRGTFVPTGPERIVDTSTGLGTCDGSPCTTVEGTGTPVEVQVGDEGPVPDEGVTAAMLLVTAEPTSGPAALVINSLDLLSGDSMSVISEGAPTSTTLVAKLDAAGAITLTAQLSDVEVQIDVLGWFDGGTNDGELGLTTVEPASVADTAGGTGGCDPSPCARLADDDAVEVQLAGAGGIPATGAEAVVVKVTATGAIDPGSVTLATDGVSAAPAAVLTVDDGRDASLVTVVEPDAGGAVTVATTVAVDVEVTVVGWYGEDDGGRHIARPAVVGLSTIEGAGTCLPSPCGTIGTASDVRVKITGVTPVPAGAAGAVVVHVLAMGTAGPATLDVNPTAGGASAATVAVAGAFPEAASTMVVAEPDEDGYVTLRASGDPLEAFLIVSGFVTPPA